MSLLKDIAPSVQQVADAIAIAVGVEVEIVDHELTIIGGSGIYADRVGWKEESGELEGNFLYARTLRSGKTELVEDAPSDRLYGSMVPEKTMELAEVCAPIKNGSEVLGIIGLIAMNESQKAVLLDKTRRMVSFVEKMADLLAAKAVQKHALAQAEASRNEIFTLLETTHEGVFSIDTRGYIQICNQTAATLLRTSRQDIIGSHISRFMMGSPALEVIRNGVEYTESEEVYTNSLGNFHFIVTAKPFYAGNQVEGVVISFRDIEEAQRLVYNINNRALKYTIDDIIGESEAIQKIKSQALLTARGNSTVLITGESGTGKEMFAKAIHYASARARKPFVTVNCGAIPENLLESELFGYEKGAFTGASERGKPGKFELADGGTIFLDEIGDMPLHLQVKILHILQNMRFERVGGTRTISVDVRVIGATNKDLEKMIDEGKFREDLYYRLSVIPLATPPLRERREDIRMICHYFLKKYNNFMNKQITDFAPEVEELYQAYDWPGNVRELENAIEYGVNMAFGSTIGIDAVPMRIRRKEASQIVLPDQDLPLSEQIRLMEREIISKKLSKYGGTSNGKDLVAKDLGLSRATLYRKLAELEIQDK